MKRRWALISGITGVLSLTVGMTVFLLLQPPNRYPFVHAARYLRGQEYIQSYPGGQQLGYEAVYRLKGGLTDSAAQVRESLQGPEWIERSVQGGQGAKFDSPVGHVTLFDRPAEGEVMVVIQEFRKPSLSDRFRIWWKKLFKR